MSEVHVPFGDKPQETATLLLAAAEDTETPVHLVRVVDGGFKVPQEVADSAGLDHTDEYEREDSALRLGDDAPDEVKDDRMLPADHDPEDNTVTPRPARPGRVEGRGHRGRPRPQRPARTRAAGRRTFQWKLRGEVRRPARRARRPTEAVVEEVRRQEGELTHGDQEVHRSSGATPCAPPGSTAAGVPSQDPTP